MMRRGEIRWANLPPPLYRRPVCIVTRDSALPWLTTVLCAPLTTRVRGIDSEVPVPGHIRLDRPTVINCDSLRPVRVDDSDDHSLGALDLASLRALDAALIYTLGILAA